MQIINVANQYEYHPDALHGEFFLDLVWNFAQEDWIGCIRMELR